MHQLQEAIDGLSRQYLESQGAQKELQLQMMEQQLSQGQQWGETFNRMEQRQNEQQESIQRLINIQALKRDTMRTSKDGSMGIHMNDSQVLPEDVLEHIRILKSPNPDIGAETMGWLPAADGRFIIKSPYEALFSNKENNNRLHKLLWKHNLPQRLKTFYWLLSHEALLTNSRRKSKNLTDNSGCPRCCGEEETMLHALRDCPYIRMAWISIKAFSESHGSSSLVRSIKELLAKMVNVEVKHIYREANFCMDALAKIGQREAVGIKLFEQPPPCLYHHLLADASVKLFQEGKNTPTPKVPTLSSSRLELLHTKENRCRESRVTVAGHRSPSRLVAHCRGSSLTVLFSISRLELLAFCSLLHLAFNSS
ncbi:hypothetical protein Ahy_B08g091483 [Arachis hypogaea]|uniref:Reverse transcriptase zinc-binding domain-containing protein n=1 Tax=Arachis hypogaea TaxID=3818 RepID=A0A444Y297_ARAHY|nr:hypothetical protein Ahy_B08g091483 [Arachis hypogaea]